MKKWLWPAVAAVALVLAIAGATLTSARAEDGHHGDRDKAKASTQTSTETTSTDTTQSSSVCGEDVTWLQSSISGDRFEIAGGTLAVAKSSNSAVKGLGQALINDHTKSLASAIDLANKLGIDVPGEPTPTQQWQLEELREMTGAAFDHDYAELEVLDHQQDIQETEDEIEMGCNADVRAEAQTDLPMLQSHLQHSQQVLQSVPSEDGAH